MIAWCNRDFWSFCSTALDGTNYDSQEKQFLFFQNQQPMSSSAILVKFQTTTTTFRVPHSFRLLKMKVYNSKITMEKIVRIVRRSRLKSAPSSLDGITYTIFKHCPALLAALCLTFAISVGESAKFLENGSKVS